MDPGGSMIWTLPGPGKINLFLSPVSKIPRFRSMLSSPKRPGRSSPSPSTMGLDSWCRWAPLSCCIAMGTSSFQLHSYVPRPTPATFKVWFICFCCGLYPFAIALSAALRARVLPTRLVQAPGSTMTESRPSVSWVDVWYAPVAGHQGTKRFMSTLLSVVRLVADSKSCGGGAGTSSRASEYSITIPFSKLPRHSGHVASVVDHDAKVCTNVSRQF